MSGTKKRLCAVLVVGGLGLAACGGSAEQAKDVEVDRADTGVVIQDRLASAAVSTVDAGSARMSMHMSIAAPGTPSGAGFTAVGVMEFASGNFQMTMDLGPLLAMTDPGAYEGVALDVEMRMVDDVMYVRYPDSLSGMDDVPTPWLSIDLGAALDDLGLPRDALAEFSQNDPSQYLKYLGAMSSAVEEVGRERVRDVDTTHYRASIDLTKAIDQVPQAIKEKLGIDGEQLQAGLAEMQSELGLTELPAEAWIDDDGLLRRMSMDLSAGGAGIKVEMELYDYGVDVAVVAPPADQVTDLFETLGSLGS